MRLKIRISRLPVRYKLIVVFLPLVLAVLTGIALFVNSQISEAVKSDFISTTAKETRLVEKYLNSVIDNAARECEYLAKHPLLRRADRSISSYHRINSAVSITPSRNGGIEQRIYELYRHFGETHPRYRYIYMATVHEGYIQYPEGRVLKNYTPSKRPYYLHAMKNPDQVSLTPVYYWPADDIFILSTVSTIRNREGRIIGVQGVDFDLPGVTGMIENISIAETGYLVLIDNKGTILANPARPELNSENIKAMQIEGVESVKDLPAGFSERTVDARERLIHTHISDKTGWYYVGLIERSELKAKYSRISNIIWIITALFMILLVPVTVKAAFYVTSPMKNLMAVMKKMQGGNFAVRARPVTSDEFGELARVYNLMADKVQNSVDTLEKEVEKRTEELRIKNEAIMNDIKIARRIQETVIKTIPHKADLRIDTEYLSMESLGGDVYHVKKRGPSTYTVFIADVSGHGVPAALITTMAMTAFLNRTDEKKTPAQVCEAVNRDIYYLIGDTEYFLTAIYAVIDIEKNTLTYANCGHHPGYIYHKDGDRYEEMQLGGFIIGVKREIKLENHETAFTPGDKLFMFTDGIPEAANNSDEFYTHERLKTVIEKHGRLTGSEFLSILMRDVEKFTGERAPDDDRAFIVVERKSGD